MTIGKGAQVEEPNLQSTLKQPGNGTPAEKQQALYDSHSNLKMIAEKSKKTRQSIMSSTGRKAALLTHDSQKPKSDRRRPEETDMEIKNEVKKQIEQKRQSATAVSAQQLSAEFVPKSLVSVATDTD